MYRIPFLLLGLLPGIFFGQGQWTWKERRPLPEPVSNQAVVAGVVNDDAFVFSFTGIDTSRAASGIHLKSWCYPLADPNWETLDNVPDTMGKVAGAASNIRDKIYLMGGYHVFSNGLELSSHRVHIYNIVTTIYEPDGAPIPIPIDDHVQAVWRDSLIYLVTGWSHNTNVAAVQIYNPSTNQWTPGTPVPNTPAYKVFGASGVIIGDTIYYAGGAQYGVNFPLGNTFRKGYIHPNQPDSISWSSFTSPHALGYRMGAFVHRGKAYWVGGSAISYNYDGIAYNGSGPVPPLNRMLCYDPATGVLEVLADTIPHLMDIRGAARVGPDSVFLVGGMTPGPTVSDRVYQLYYQDNPPTGRPAPIDEPFAETYISERILTVKVPDSQPFQVNLYQLDGKRVWQSAGEQVKALKSNLAHLPVGVYVLEVQGGKKSFRKKIMLAD